MASFWEELGKKFGEKANTVQAKAQEQIEIQKIKAQIRTLERGNDEDFEELGSYLYEQFKAGEELGDELTAIREAIKSREDSIAEYQMEISKIKGDFPCEACGKMLSKGMSFCPFCGTVVKVEEPEEAEVVEEETTEVEEAAEEVVEEVETEEAVEADCEEAAEEVEETVEEAVEE